MKRFKCWLIGHSTDCCDPWNTRCFRCGHEWNYGDRVRDDLWFYLGWYDLFSPRIQSCRFKRWWKCPDCDKRFGRHADDCFPF